MVAKGHEQAKEEQQQEQQLRQREEEEEQRVYLVTEGLRSKYTKASYASAFRHFKEFMSIQDDRILASYEPRKIEQSVIHYIEMLAKNGLKRITVELHKAAIFHFFEMNDIVLNKRKISRFVPRGDSDDVNNNNDNYNASFDRAYTVEEIGRIINQGCNDLRSKLMIILMASTGMRVGALYDLSYCDLIKLDKYPLYQIWVYARSKSDRYYTFATPECTELIDSYLDYRRRLGENITEKSPLILEMFDTNNPFIINQPRRLTDRMAQIVLEQALKRSGVNQGLQSDGTVRRAIMRSHGFRKFAITQMKKAKVDFSDREYLVGHKASLGLDFNYDRTTVDDRLEEWSKAIPLLTIHSESRLEQQIQELRSGQLQNIDQIHKRWEEELKGKYALIPKREWECMKGEMKFIQENIVPAYNMQLFKEGKPTLHFDSNYNYNNADTENDSE